MDKLAFLFPGQGVQFVKMGEKFYNSNVIARQTYDEASEVLGADVANLCFRGNFSELNDFTKMQIAIVTTEIAMYRTYKDIVGVEPCFFLGHSVGEYSALIAAGALAFCDAIKVLRKRGELVQKIIDSDVGYMTIVENLDLYKLVEQIKIENLKDQVKISCINSTYQIALSGTASGLERIEKKIVETGAIISPLISAPPMHSMLMEPIRDEFFNYLNEMRFFPFRVPIISNVTGRVFSNVHELPMLMSDQLICPVEFVKCIKTLYYFGIGTCIEMGPKKLLLEFVNIENDKIQGYCYGVNLQREEIEKLLLSDKFYYNDKPNFVGNCLSILASTENRNNNEEEFLFVQNLYKKLKKIYETDVQGNYSRHEILLDVIKAMRVKKLDYEEIKSRIKMLLDNTNTFYDFQKIYNQIGK